MNRRLYFLLPEVHHAGLVVEELKGRGIPESRLHVMAADGVDIGSLPPASAGQRRDRAGHLERGLWFGNLLLFALALLVLVLMIGSGKAWVWWLLPLAVLLATLIAGLQFVRCVPDVHLDEFRDALRHGEILLMVDVARAEVAEIEAQVHRRHPEAVPGGVSWCTDVLPV